MKSKQFKQKGSDVHICGYNTWNSDKPRFQSQPVRFILLDKSQNFFLFSVLMFLFSSLMANKAAVWMTAMSLKRLRRPSRATLPHRLSPSTSDLIELSSLGQSNTVSKWQDTEEDHLWQQLQVNPAPACLSTRPTSDRLALINQTVFR